MVNLSLGEDYTQLIERLTAMVRERFEKGHPHQSAALVDFCNHYYSAAPFQELQRKRSEDLYGMTVGLWDFIGAFPDGTPRIRVYNPVSKIMAGKVPTPLSKCWRGIRRFWWIP